MRISGISTIVVAVALSAAATTAGAATLSSSQSSDGRQQTAARTSAPSPSAVVAAARAAALAHSAQTGIGRDNQLVATDVMIDASGTQHVRFHQTYRGIPVTGGDLIVHLRSDSTYLDVTRAAHSAVSVKTTTAKLTAAQAKAKAARLVHGGTATTGALTVAVLDGKPTLAYQVGVAAPGGDIDAARTVTVDATTGAVLRSAPVGDGFLTPQVLAKLRARGEHATPRGTVTGTSAARRGTAKPSASFPAPAVGTGKSIFSGTISLHTTQTAASSYKLIDTTRGNSEVRDAKHVFSESANTFSTAKALTDTDDVWGNGTTSDNASAAVDAQYGLTSTFDFYKNTFQRNGIEGDGAGTHGVVHVGRGWANAEWLDDCKCMIYGDGDGQTFTKPLVVLDVTGHELTHGVVSATAGLETDVDSSGNQIGEPGSLNESLADIFGSASEFSARPTTGNYLMGEQLGLSQGFLRRLDHPSLDKLEGTVDYWSSNAPTTEVHAGSGVSSHAFYLLAEGSGQKTVNGVSYNSPTSNNSTVAGIGRAKAIAIFYQALTHYMVSTTDFHDARTATLRAAADLYGQTSTEYKTVDAAWAAVNVTATNGS